MGVQYEADSRWLRVSEKIYLPWKAGTFSKQYQAWDLFEENQERKLSIFD